MIGQIQPHRVPEAVGAVGEILYSPRTIDGSCSVGRRFLLVGTSLALVLAACASAMTPDEYVEGLNVLAATGRSEFEAAASTYNQIAEPALADEIAFLEQEVFVRSEFLDGFEALEPPESIADVHRLLGGAFAWLTNAADGLAASAGAVSSIGELEQTPEFDDYQAANADGAHVCLEVQAKLEDLAASSETLTDVPWVSGLGLVVQAALGCGEIETG